MTTDRIVYAVICAAALLYMAIANAFGYIPFASPVAKTVDRTASHFHK